MNLKNKRDNNGKFTRVHDAWVLDNFNDGYVDGDGRFRVYFPYHKRANEEGYIFRSVIAYETYNNIMVPQGMDIHHKDGNRLNDIKENLFMLSHSEHAKIHNAHRKIDINRICEFCGKQFYIKRWRLNRTDCERGRFCSHHCCYEWRKVNEWRKLN